MEERNEILSGPLSQVHPADVADRLEKLSLEEMRLALSKLPLKEEAAVLAEMEKEQVIEVLSTLSTEELTALLKELPHNKAADIAAELPIAQQGEALAGLAPEESAQVRALLRYPEDSAGGIMSDRFISLREIQTVGESQEMLRGRAEQRGEDISYLYVTDAKERLVGVVSLRDLLFRRSERRIEEIMNRDVKFLQTNADQEEIARQFERYHYLGLPVVELDGRLVGIVRANDVIQVMQDEATEDMQLMVGLSGEERASTPWRKSMKKRLPWLCVNIGTAFLAASVVGFFESTIAQWTVLAVFLPVVAGQGGNAGMQTLTIIIRELALGGIAPGDGRKALVKELTLGLMNGLAIGLIVGLVGYFWKGSMTLGVVVGLAMVLNMVSAACAGVLIPFTLKAMKIDPALASSIFVTMVTDVAGFFFFLGLAAAALKWFL